MKIFGIIYLVRNKVNNKIYFGQTINDFDTRYRGDIFNTHNSHLKNSIKKYGIENFYIDKYFDVAYNRRDLNELESMYIRMYNTTNQNYGYNLTVGGNNGIINDELRKKISDNTKNQWQTMSEQTIQELKTKNKLKAKQQWQNMSEYELKQYSNKMRDIWYSKSEYERDRISKDRGKSVSGGNNGRAQKVVGYTLEFEMFFDSISLACEYFNIQQASISKCCINSIFKTGMSQSNLPLTWSVLEDYKLMAQSEKDKKIEMAIRNVLYCYETQEIFNNQNEIIEKYSSIGNKYIIKCCKQKQINLNNNKLNFLKYADFLNNNYTILKNNIPTPR